MFARTVLVDNLGEILLPYPTLARNQNRKVSPRHLHRNGDGALYLRRIANNSVPLFDCLNVYHNALLIK
jgi:hypothetical protein